MSRKRFMDGSRPISKLVWRAGQSEQDGGVKPLFPPKSREAAYAELSSLIHKAPPERSRWTLASIRQAVSWLQAHSLACVWQTLTRWGLVYKRGREALHSPDADYDLKLAYIEAAQAHVLRQPEQV